MSGPYYPPHTSAPEDDSYEYSTTLHPQLAQQQQIYQGGLEQSTMSMASQQQMYYQPQPLYTMNQQPSSHLVYPSKSQAQQSWVTPVIQSNYHYSAQAPIAFPAYTEYSSYPSRNPYVVPSTSSARYLSPDEAEPNRLSRAASFASNTSEFSLSDISRSVSPNASEMAKWGRRNQDGTWSCSFPGCTSRSIFNRGCDLRKHYKRHTKTLFCRHEGCPQATEGGFSSKKDRARHEASHNPMVACEWPDCERMFSRMDNMKDHVRRVHRRAQR